MSKHSIQSTLSAATPAHHLAKEVKAGPHPLLLFQGHREGVGDEPDGGKGKPQALPVHACMGTQTSSPPCAGMSGLLGMQWTLCWQQAGWPIQREHNEWAAAPTASSKRAAPKNQCHTRSAASERDTAAYGHSPLAAAGCGHSSPTARTSVNARRISRLSLPASFCASFRDLHCSSSTFAASSFVVAAMAQPCLHTRGRTTTDTAAMPQLPN